MAYSEVHADERAVTNLGFWRRAKALFESCRIVVERMITDNDACYRSKEFAQELLQHSITHTFTALTGRKRTERCRLTTAHSSTSGPTDLPVRGRPNPSS
jgi:hypothetical protein